MRPTTARRWTARNIAAVVIVVGFVTSGFVLAGSTAGRADTTPLPGVPVPVADRVALATAGGACPALGVAKLSGQIMAESGFDPDSTGRGGRGLAHLTDAEWDAWRPSRTADRADPAATIAALAHLTCDLVGQVRLLDLPGDRWQLAVAAFRAGIPAVNAARGVPPDTRDYVERVIRYATWYALTPDGSAPAQPSPSPALTLVEPASPVPAAATTAPSPSAPPSSTRPPAPATTRAAPAPTPKKTTTKPALPSGALVNDEFHGCLSANKALDGTQLIEAGCDASAVEHWQAMPDGTIRSVGLCMDAAGGSTADWTPVQVAVCSGNPAQHFALNGSGHIYSSYADKCVNINYDAGTNTTQIVLFSCLNQTNQIFRFQQQ